MFVPVYLPIWHHHHGAPLGRRSAQGAYTRGGPSPTGYHSAANHLPPQPVRHQSKKWKTAKSED